MAISIVGTPQGGGSNNGGNVTLTFDVSPQENDYVLVWGGYSVDASADFTPAPGPSTAGYTTIKQITSAAPGFYVGYKKQGGSPDSNVVCQGSGDTGCATSYGCAVLRGVDPTTFEDAAATETGPTSGVPDGPASSTTATLNAWCIVCAGNQVNDATKGTITDFNALADGTANDTLAFSSAAQYRVIDSLRSENPGAWSSWSSGTYRAVTILVRPVVATPYSADLTAPDFGIDPQGVTRLNDYLVQATAPAFAFTAQSITRLNDWITALTAPTFSFTALDMIWDVATGFVAELTAATLSMTAQTISRFNDYITGLSAPAFTFTAQTMNWFQDMVMVLSAAQMSFTARVMAWSDGTQQYIACIFHALSKKHRRMWRLLNGPSSPFQQ